MRIAKPFRRYLALMLAAAVCFQILSGLTARAAVEVTDVGVLGDMFEYNGIIFDYFESTQADTEGAVAVWGKSHMATQMTFCVGATHMPGNTQVIGTPTDSGIPALVLGGEVVLGSRPNPDPDKFVNVYGGDIILSEEWEDQYKAGPIWFQKGISPPYPKYAKKEVIDAFFQNAYDTIVHTQNVLNNAHKGDPNANVALSDFDGWGNTKWRNTWKNLDRFVPTDLNYVADYSKLLVINVTDDTAVTIRETYITQEFKNYNWVVFNFPNVTNATFTGSSVRVEGIGQLDPTKTIGYADNKHVADYAPRLIWNFPKADTVRVQAGVIGSVIAPHALVEGSGNSINGMLVADSFITKGGCELHAFRMKPPNLKEFDESKGEAKVIVYKYDSSKTDEQSVESHTLLTGAEFSLTRYNTVSKQYEAFSYHSVVQNDRIEIGPLEEGSYRLVETKAPEGYLLDPTPVFFSVSASDTLEHPIYLYVGNQPEKTKLVIEKVDSADSSKLLPGATFELYRANGQMTPVLIQRETTDDNGKITIEARLTEGTYHLVEAVAPDGYHRINGYVEIQVDFDQTNTPAFRFTYKGTTTPPPTTTGGFSWDGTEHTLTILVTNEQRVDPPPDPTDPDPILVYDVLINKTQEGDDHRPVEGAEFSLEKFNELTKQWEVVPEYSPSKTDHYGHVYLDRLVEGLYRLIEIKAPPGYQVNAGEEAYVFQVPADNFASPLSSPAGQAVVPADDSDTAQSPPQGEDSAPAPADTQPAVAVVPAPDQGGEGTVSPGDSDSHGTGSADVVVVEDHQGSPDPPADSLLSPSVPELATPASAAMGGAVSVSISPLGMAHSGATALAPAPVSTRGTDRRDSDPVVSVVPRKESSPARLANRRDDDSDWIPGRDRDIVMPVPVQPEPDPAEPSGDQRAVAVPRHEERDSDLPAAPGDGSSAQRQGAAQAQGDGQIPADTPRWPVPFGDPPTPYSSPTQLATPTQIIDITNRATGKITVEKRDIHTDAMVEGAGFGLYYNVGSDAAGGIGNRWERVAIDFTNEHGIVEFTDLVPGQYRVMEVVAPPDYEPITDPEPVAIAGIEPAQHVAAIGENGLTKFTFVAHNPRTVGSISLKKMDGDTQQPLAGAFFRLTRWNDTDKSWDSYGEPQGYTTGADGMIRPALDELPYGRYKLVEITAPSGYEIESQFNQSELMFTINQPGRYWNMVIPVYNFRESTTTPPIDPPTTTTPGGSEDSDRSRSRDRDPGIRYPTTETPPSSLSADPEDDPNRTITGDLPNAGLNLNPPTGSPQRTLGMAVSGAVGMLVASAVYYRRKFRD